MTLASPKVSNNFRRDPKLLEDPKIISALVPASKLGIKKESLYLESLYDNPLSPIEYGTSLGVKGEQSSTIEVGMHILATALEKQNWACVLDPTSRISSPALYESVLHSPRFVCVRNFSANNFVSTLSYLVVSMRVVVAYVPTVVTKEHMSRVMARVRENKTILVMLDPGNYLHASTDNQLVANTTAFEGLNKGAGAILDRKMDIAEYKHGMLRKHG